MRKISSNLIFLALLLACPLLIVAQEISEIDPVLVSPDRFKIIVENDHVRVIEYVLEPGQRDDWHTDPPKVSYVLEPATLRITTEDGSSFLTEETTGEASWMGTLGRHYAENVGQTKVRILLVEVKAAE